MVPLRGAISGEAGVNMAMLNYYFGSKEGLFIAIFERKIKYFKDLILNLGSIETNSAWEKVERYIDLYSERVVNNNCFQKIIYQEMASMKRGELTEKLSDMLMTNINEFHKILKEGIDSGEFNSDIDANMVTATLYGTKNFLFNTPHVSSIMMKHDIQDEKFLAEKLKPRIKAYFKRLLKAYLLKEHDNTIK